MHAHYDLQNGRYLAFGIKDKSDSVRFDAQLSEGDFSPDALRREGER